jgi:hypothetical protein
MGGGAARLLPIPNGPPFYDAQWTEVHLSTTFFHFTNWQLTDEHVGKVLTAEWEVSNYWKQKLTKGWVLPFKLPDNVVVNGTKLSDFSDVLNHGKYTSELLKEYVFEEIRSTEYPSKPNRRRCLFAFSTAHDPDEYAKRLGFERARYRLIEIRALDDARTHCGDMVHLNTNLSDYTGLAEAARRYWGGADERSATSELLLEGKFELIRLL